MCGISGAWPFSAGLSPDALEARTGRMTRALVHRGPDQEGVWVDPEGGPGLGFRRLAILDLSPTGHQPMRSADGRWVCVFNGEVYNYQDLKAELAALGHGFRGTSDTEVLLAGITEWGVEGTLRRANAMLALAAWDRQERRLWLARDRLGKKPLYYGLCGDTLLFGSELKALAAWPSFERHIDRDALGAYLQYGWVPGPRTIWQGIAKLPAASLVSIERGRVGQPVAYWSARAAALEGAAAPFDGPFEAAVDTLDGLLRDSVARRMVADVPLGALLSGGIDSSTVVALMQAQSDRRVRTFSIGFKEAKYDEAPHAAAVARHLGTEHTELYVSAKDGQDLVPDLPEIWDEPFADPSQIPTYLVSRLARRHVTVALSGDGGDELFGGYTSYPSAMRSFAKIARRPLWWRRLAADPMRRTSEAGWGMLGTTGGRVGPGRRWLGKLSDRARSYAAADPVELFAQRRARWPQPDLALGAGRLVTPLSDGSAWLRGIAPEQAMMHLDLVTYHVDDILVKVDRASMAVSLEMRAPLLDWRVVELAWRLPLAFRLHGGEGKRVLRAVLDRYVPRALVDRPKAGFGVPVAAWLRGPLRDWAEELLDPARLAADGLLDRAAVRRIWHQHQSGWRNHEDLVWAILMFQAWHERWARAEPTGFERPASRPAATGALPIAG